MSSIVNDGVLTNTVSGLTGVTEIVSFAFSNCGNLEAVYRYTTNPDGPHGEDGVQRTETLLTELGITVGSNNDPLYNTKWYFE